MNIGKIGFIGQGYIGKNYADDFERRGFAVVRYSAEREHAANKEEIGKCDVVFIAVPTPTTPKGFDLSIVRAVIPLVGKGKIAVIKSTLVPGSTQSLQTENPGITVLCSPEFLSEATAAHDAASPAQNIVGIPEESPRCREAAALVLSLLPKAPSLVMKAVEAELFKYAHNVNGYFQILLFNMLYDFAAGAGAEWEPVKEAIRRDPFMSAVYANPVHKSGRGAGGHCFIKDFEAFIAAYREKTKDELGTTALGALRDKNLRLLLSSGKDLDLIAGVYGEHYGK
ncbi:hypothetical protein KW797_04135 [Candidatus Parcubacteria bacterium]|nr:hypothetical protein [Candidatus Parcubacteria bacterium]